MDKDIIFHSDIAPNRKKDPGERFVMNSIGITRFYNQKKVKKKYSVDEMLLLYWVACSRFVFTKRKV